MMMFRPYMLLVYGAQKQHQCCKRNCPMGRGDQR